MSARDELVKEIELRLGGGIVDVELDAAHYDLAISKSVRKFRQRSSRAVREEFIKLDIIAEKQEYQLPMNVNNVRDVLLRSTGTMGISSGVDIEPFNTAYLNNMLLQHSTIGGLLNYELTADRRELMARMFGGYVTFTWNSTDRKIFIHRKFKSNDEIYLWCFVERDVEDLLNDTYGSPWIRDYAFAQSKLMLGEARSKFATIAGPQGGTSLNGDAIKNEAQAEIEKLDQELVLLVDASDPPGFIIG